MLEGRDEGLLDGLLGEIEVSKLADERRERPPGFLAKDAIDDGMRIGRASGSTLGRQSPNSQIGRTSIAPDWAPGIFAANSRASSRSFTSSR
jgi:hypothetical protein